ncbi:MAG: DNA polymerase III subunit delta' [Aeromicrobium sp.]|nr:MAG: DNA polymerase III subunit delta' [Aeromicrobium sp.]
MSDGVWSDLVGQERAVQIFRSAAEGAMTHAWLITGPPGSGRSTSAVAFAAALQCPNNGCGQCKDCQMVLDGTHADVTVIDTEGLSIGVDTARDVVRRAAMFPSVGEWQIIIVEDADRLTEQAANALLKSIEEPSPKTVWFLCAPFAEDVLVTIRSRSRLVVLATPPSDTVAAYLVRKDGVDPETAQFVASASQGHIGRARALARNPEAQARRRDIVALPMRMRSLADVMSAASQIVAEAQSRAETQCDELDAKELAALQSSWGVEEKGKRPTGYAGALSALKKDQDSRRKRIARDEIDRVLIELMSALRDVLSVQLKTGQPLVNPDVRQSIEEFASRTTAKKTLASLDAIAHCRKALAANAAPQIAMESMFVRMVS